MKKILALLSILLSTILLTSCGWPSEEEKIINDLDLEIQEFLEENPESDLDKTWDEKDEIEAIKETEEKIEELGENNNSEEKVNEEIKSKNTKTIKTIDEFAKCITENWAKAYWTSWCSHCQKQKEMFWEEAAKNLNFTDCDSERKACKDAWITWYPTWVINWEQYPWVQSFEKLWELTWCKLEQ